MSGRLVSSLQQAALESIDTGIRNQVLLAYLQRLCQFGVREDGDQMPPIS